MAATNNFHTGMCFYMNEISIDFIVSFVWWLCSFIVYASLVRVPDYEKHIALTKFVLSVLSSWCSINSFPHYKRRITTYLKRSTCSKSNVWTYCKRQSKYEKVTTLSNNISHINKVSPFNKRVFADKARNT